MRVMEQVPVEPAKAPSDSRLASQNFGRVVRGLCEAYDNPDLLEIGGGAKPLFRPGSWPDNVASYTINDISQEELDKAPAEYNKACFDICDPVEGLEGRFDVIFSKFVAEHVKDGRKMHSNVYRMLRPGGVAFHLFPTLYALPFFINWLIPEHVSRGVVFLLNPVRRDNKRKFPAYYSWCAGSNEHIRIQILSVGYADVKIERFYGHTYLSRIPLLSSVEAAWVSAVKKAEMTRLGSYAYVFARR
jgi:SAM-dependent methyltransferase